MPLGWKDISGSEEYGGLTPDRKEEVRVDWFNRRVAPNLPASKHATARAQWDKETLPKPAPIATSMPKAGELTKDFDGISDRIEQPSLGKQQQPQREGWRGFSLGQDVATGAIAEPEAPDTESAFEFSIDQAQKLLGRGVQSLGELSGIEAVGEYGKGVVEQQKKDIAEGGFVPEYSESFTRTFDEQGFSGVAGWVGEALATNWATTGVSLAGGLASVATAPFSAPAALALGLGTTGLVYLQSVGETAGEMEESGGDVNNALAATVGAGVAALDRLGLGKVLPKAKLAELGKQLHKMTGEEFVESLTKAGAKEAAEKAEALIMKGATAAKAGATKKAARGLVGEGVTESLQETLMMSAAAIQGGDYTPREVIDRVIDSFIVGGAMGAGVAQFGGGYTPDQERSRMLQNGEHKPSERLRAAQVVAQGIGKKNPALAGAFMNLAVKRITNGQPLIGEGESFYGLIKPLEQKAVDDEINTQASEVLGLPAPEWHTPGKRPSPIESVREIGSRIKNTAANLQKALDEGDAEGVAANRAEQSRLLNELRAMRQSNFALPEPSGIADRPIIVDPEGQAGTQTQQQIDVLDERRAATKERLIDEATPEQELLPAPEGLGDRPIIVEPGGEARRMTQQDIDEANVAREASEKTVDMFVSAKQKHAKMVEKDYLDVNKALTELKKTDISAPIDESRDGLLAILAKGGGLSAEEAVAQGIDPEATREAVGRRKVFRKEGMTFDEAGEFLSQHGFFQTEPYSANAVLDLVSRAVNQGEEIFSTAADEHQAKLADLREREESLGRLHGELLSEVGEITDYESSFVAELYNAVRNDVDIDDIEAAIGDVTNPDADFFENISLLQDLQDGRYQERQERPPVEGVDEDAGTLAEEPAADRGGRADTRDGVTDIPEGEADAVAVEQEAEPVEEVPDQALDNAKKALIESIPSGRLFDLAGKKNSEARQKTMSALIGKKVAKSASGLNALKDEFYRRAGITGETEAEKESAFVSWATGEKPAITSDEIDAKAHEAATSPLNDLPEPTEGQISAENYKKGEPFNLHGLTIVIENPKGSERKGTDDEGKAWSNTMGAHYGDIKRTEGADGDAIDVFVGSNPESKNIYVIDQKKINGNKGGFDETKVMVGFSNRMDAMLAYKSSYDKGWGVGPMTTATIPEFKEWIANGDTTKPYSAFKPAAPLVLTQETEAERQAREQAEQKAIDDEAAKQQAEADKAKKATEAKAEKQAVDTSVDRFELGQAAEQQLSGQVDLVDDAAAAVPEREAAEPEKKTTKGAELAEKAETKIEDFGEKIEGARKHQVSFSEAVTSEIDVSAVPLSKSLPKPDYEKLADAGISHKALAVVAHVRRMIASKPRQAHKLKRWADQVNVAREVASSLIKGEVDVDKFIDSMKGMQSGEVNYKYMPDVFAIAEEILPEQIQDLASFSLNNAFYSIFEGEKNVEKWVVTDHGAKAGFGGMGNQAHFDTKEEALAFIKTKVTTVDKKGKPQAKFDVWTERGRDDYVVGKKLGPRKYIELKGGFKTAAEARNHISENNAALVEQLKEKKKIRAHRRLENNPRIGKNYRDGKNVTPEQFADAFGFRGVQFGNWVENDKRQQDLNNAYDGLMDLAELLNVPPKALSLNGELGLALGARGKGGKDAPSAHYESDQVVINLTKREGAGSLAHEWWHALDNYFGKLDRDGDGKISGEEFATDQLRQKHMQEVEDGKTKYREAVLGDFGSRQEMYDAFRAIQKTIADSEIPNRSVRLDDKRTKDYWSTDIEMSARAFERYVIDRLADNGNESDYLANILRQEEHEQINKVLGENEPYPYPTDDEMASIGGSFDHLFDTVKTRETDKGTALYSRSQEQIANILTPDSDFLIGDLPRDMREELFNEHATNLNPEATEKGFYSERVPSGTINIENLLVDPIPEEQIQYHLEVAPDKLPPIVISDGRLIDGQHRIVAARSLGVKELRYIDVTGLIDTDAGGFISELPTTKFAQEPVGVKPENAHTAETLRTAMEEAFPGVSQVLEDSGALQFIKNEHIPEESAAEFKDNSGRTLAFVLGDNVFFVSDNIPKGHDVKGLMLHELGVHLNTMGKNADEFQSLLGRFEKMRDSGHKKARAAFDRVPPGTVAENQTEEALAYFVEQNQEQSFAKKVIEWFRSKLKSWIRSVTKGKDQAGLVGWANSLSEGEIISMAAAAVRKPGQKAIGDAVMEIEAAAPGDIKYSKSEREYTPEQRSAMETGGFGKQTDKKERFESISERFGTTLRQKTVDQYASFKDVLEDSRAWMMGHLTSSAPGAVEAVIRHGRPILKDNVVTVDTDTKGLQEAIEPLGAELDDWLAWMAGHRAGRLSKEDKENLFSGTDITALKSLSKGKMADGQERTLVYQNARKDFEAINNAIVQMAVDTGLVGKEEAALWAEQGFYVPFYRVLEEGESRGPRGLGGLAKQTAYKKLKGGTSQLDDLMTNVLMNWNHLISASLKNQASAQALKTAEEIGLAEQVPAAAKSKNAIYVRENGKEKWYELTEDKDGQLVLESLLSLNWEGLNTPSMKAMAAFKRALTTGVTVNPEFKIANLIRDTLTAIAVAPMSMNFLKNVKQGWTATSKDSETMTQMLAGGGAFGSSGYIDGSSPEAVKRLVDRGVSRDTILDSRKLIKKMWDSYQELGARGENINRASNYEQALAAGKDRLTAQFESRDHLDFTRTGTATAVRALARVVPFLNARLQGLDKLARASTDPQQRAQFATVIATYSAASILLFLSMKDDEDYKEAQDWERDTYHLFKLPGSDILWRLPRPFEVGAIGSLAERAVEQFVNDDVNGDLFAERLGHTVLETFSMNPTPQMVKPLIEIFANKSFFTGRTIESMAQRRLSPERRQRIGGSETAAAVSKGMSKVLPEKATLSPVQIEHMVRGYLGWLGSTVLGAADMLVTRPLSDAPERPARHITEYPVIKRFARGGTPRSTKYTQIYYDRLRDLNQTFSDIADARRAKEFEEADKLLEGSRDKLRYRKWINKRNRVIQKLRARMKSIRVSGRYSPEQKRTEIDAIQENINRMQREIVEQTNKDFR